MELERFHHGLSRLARTKAVIERLFVETVSLKKENFVMTRISNIYEGVQMTASQFNQDFNAQVQRARSAFSQ